MKISISRVFDAPVAKVWQAWSDPTQLMRWWGPKEFTSPACTMDFKVGGKYHFCMRAPDGKDYWSTGVYKEIIPMQKIVCSDSFADAEGNVVPASYYNMPGDFPLEMLVVVTFEADGNKTKMHIEQDGHLDGQTSEMATQGWNQSLDKLAASLSL